MFNRKLKKGISVLNNKVGTIYDESIKTLKNHKENIDALYDLFEKLGQKVKDDRESTAKLIAGIMVFVGAKLDENNNNVIKNVKPKSCIHIKSAY